MNSKLVITLATLVLLLAGTYVAIQWAKGYRLNPTEVTVEGRGLLVANSDPTGATVFVNDELESATDDTIHLAPGQYTVRLERDGYQAWEKILKLEEELVTQTDARLFPAAPNLSALTVNGASQPHPSPNGQRIAYKIATGSATPKYGIWVTELSDNPLRFGASALQLLADTPTQQFSQADLFWTPNSNQLLVYFSDTEMYLVDITQESDPADLVNAAFQIESLLVDWQDQLVREQQNRIAKLPEQMQAIATQSATLLYFSPNEEKLLYTATASATLPKGLIPPVLAKNSQPQTRELTAGHTYVYDTKEDTNFFVTQATQTMWPKLATASALFSPSQQVNLADMTASESAAYQEELIINPPEDTRPLTQQLTAVTMQYSPYYAHNLVQWFPNSQHLITTQTDNITIQEYDGTNQHVIYSGPFSQGFAYPWPNGDKLVILTSLSLDPDRTSNLYAIDLQ